MSADLCTVLFTEVVSGSTNHIVRFFFFLPQQPISPKTQQKKKMTTEEEPQQPHPRHPPTSQPRPRTPYTLSENALNTRKLYSLLLIFLLLSIAYPFTPLTWLTTRNNENGYYNNHSQGAYLFDLFCGDLALACACYFHWQIASLDHSVIVQFPSFGFSRTVIRNGYLVRTEPFVPSWLWRVERDFWLFGLTEGALLWWAYAYCQSREDVRRLVGTAAVLVGWYVGWSATPQGRKDWAWGHVKEFWFWMAASRIFRGGWVGVRSFGDFRF